MDAKKQRLLDAEKLKECGPGWKHAFVAPTIPEPTTDIEKLARVALSEQGIDVSSSLMVHIYDVIEAVERAIRNERKSENLAFWEEHGINVEPQG